MVMNEPVNSKINAVGLALAFLGLAITADWIPAKYEEALTELIIVGGPIVIVLLRSFWTNDNAVMKRLWKKWVG